MSFKYEMERTMKIINNIEIDNPNQWIERFVEQVLENAGIDCEQALIEEIEEEKRILLSCLLYTSPSPRDA